MTKPQFINALQGKLSHLSQEEIEERLTFYCEMIDDGMDEGLSEEEAVARIGSIADITADIPDATPKTEKQKLSGVGIALLILGAPLWISLLVAAFAVVISLLTALWSAIVSLWASEVALCGAALGGMLLGIGLICSGSLWTGIAYIGMTLVCAGLSLFLFYGCKAATKGAVRLTKTTAVKIKHYFFNRGYAL